MACTEAAKQSARSWYVNHKEVALARGREYRNKNRPRIYALNRKSRLKVRWGLTVEQWEEMAKNGCYICGSRVRLSVDHDHATGRIRGILCTPHNKALGLFHDNREHLIAAAKYLGGL